MEISAKKTKRQNTIDMRQKRQRELLLEKLRETHILGVACKKASISRAAYYRWREDKEFAIEADEALREGKETMNDFAESQLMKKVAEGNMHAIKYFLGYNKNEYRYRPDLIADMERHREMDEFRHSWKYIIEETKKIDDLKNENKQLMKKISELESSKNKPKNGAN
ncbi:MAG: hypothetical protein US63_C0008G0017 [Candidatus Moranbacteria bacterium GW2011_GWC2_37_8]|nr:MAG: hypothetical protein US63_C0008G0017 [Candidatus Moranbacteria bacterium GW2011_GWC2_37_8]KKQ62398.1 MAG: hypothetical protein US82_C0012G0016 [Parcubacteria group bacterium GW2011_GWC1_38_22]